MPAPLTIPCPIKSNCACEGNPVPNYSSEAPDRRIFFSMNWGWGTTNGPNPGDLYTNPNGFYICVDTNSQDDADICAAAGEIQNEVDGGGSDPGDRTDPNGNHYFLYGNSQQTCSRDCGDGTHFTYTIAAGRVNALSQILADRIANSLACNLANKYAICISNISGACLGDEYDQLITATTQTTGDIDWSLRSGMLPPGIEFLPDLFNTRQISLFGTPTVPGNYVFTIRATDRLGNFTDKTFTLAVIGFTNSPTQATVGSAYSFQFHATGGTAPYTFSVTPGTLPAGLTMSASGLITGTPTSTTAKTFTVTVEDNSGNQCQNSFTMTPTSAVSLATYWTFDKPGEPVLTPFGPAFFVTWSDQVGNYGIQRLGTAVPHTAGGIIGNAGVDFSDDGIPDDFYSGLGLPNYDSAQVGFSMIGWFKYDVFPFAPTGLVLFVATGPGIALGVSSDYDGVNMRLVVQPSNTFLTPGVAGAYFFLAYTYNPVSGQEKLYYNGILIYTGGIAPMVGNSSLQLSVGDCTNGSQVRFDELGYWNNRLLTQAQVTALYNGGAGLTWPAVNSI